MLLPIGYKDPQKVGNMAPYPALPQSISVFQLPEARRHVDRWLRAKRNLSENRQRQILVSNGLTDHHLTDPKSRAGGSSVYTDLQFMKPPFAVARRKHLVGLLRRAVGAAWVSDTARPDSSVNLGDIQAD